MKSMKCVCGELAEYEESLMFNGHEIDGWVCKSCGETFYNPEQAERILLLNKIKKVKYFLKLNKVKSNLILRIPKEVGEALGLEKGDKLELDVKDQKELVLRPASSY